MKLSELKEKLEELTKDLPEGADPHILILDENGYSSEMETASLQSWDIYQSGIIEKLRTDYIMYLEAE